MNENVIDQVSINKERDEFISKKKEVLCLTDINLYITFNNRLNLTSINLINSQVLLKIVSN